MSATYEPGCQSLGPNVIVCGVRGMLFRRIVETVEDVPVSGGVL